MGRPRAGASSYAPFYGGNATVRAPGLDEYSYPSVLRLDALVPLPVPHRQLYGARTQY